MRNELNSNANVAASRDWVQEASHVLAIGTRASLQPSDQRNYPPFSHGLVAAGMFFVPTLGVGFLCVFLALLYRYVSTASFK